MKQAFTMIELIFVIVIIGILAAVAIPKLSATRDDAVIASEVNSAVQILTNLGAVYSAQGNFTNYTATEANLAIDCFTFTTTVDGNVTVTLNNVDISCPSSVNVGVGNRASKNGLLLSDKTARTHRFGASNVKF